MRRRSSLTLLALAIVALAAALWPSPTFACQINDPGCFIDDFVHKQLYQFDLSIWQINRAGLTLARWFEDLRVWLIESVMVNVFTTLSRPVIQFFTLALIVAWMLFIISFMVQSFVDFRWVDIRRALRPILLAWLVYQFGGNFVLWTEIVRVQGGSLLQQTAQEVTETFEAPGISSATSGDMPDASRSIYASDTSCGTSKREIEAMYLSDYAARYLWSNGEDVHCGDLLSLAGEFGGQYFARRDISEESDADKRQIAVGWAAQGGLRQITGIFMVVGAIVEQIVHQTFALSLAMVWFGLLLSLVFAVFLPTEALLGSQIKAILTVLRGSWLASLLIGLGLAVLRLVAASGNGFLMFFSGLVLIAVCVWQGKQALATVGTAMLSMNTVMGSAPSAVGGMVKSWATTAAVVAGVAATGGGLGAALGQVGSTMMRRAGRNVGDNPVSQAAGRVLSSRLADKLDARLEDRRLERDAELSTQEAAWYERQLYDGAGEPAIDSHASRQRATSEKRARQQLAQLKERQAERARKAGNFRKADRLRREARQLGGGDTQPDSTAMSTDGDELDLDGAVERLHEAGDDEEMQRRVLADVAAQSHRRAQLKAVRNRALREKRFDDAKVAIGELRAMDDDAPPPSARQSSPQRQAGASAPDRSTQEIRDLNAEIERLGHQIAAYEQQLQTPGADVDAARDGLLEARTRLAASMQRLAELHPTPPDEYQAALTPMGSRLEAGMALQIARTAGGLVVNGHEVLNTRIRAGGGIILDTAAGSVPLAAEEEARVHALPIGEVLRLPPAAGSSSSSATPAADPGDSAPAGAPAAASGNAAPASSSTAAPGATSPGVANGSLPATGQQAPAGAPPVVVQGSQPTPGRSVGASDRRERVGAVAHGAIPVDGAAGRPLHVGDAAPPSAAGVSNVPQVSPLPAAPARAIEQPDGEPPASTSLPGAAEGAAANVPAVPAPAAPRSASAPADQPQPVSGTTATPSVAAPAPESVPAPAQATPAAAAPVIEAGPLPATPAPASTPAPAPAPRATNGLPLANSSGTAAPLPAQAAPGAEARERAVQPARAASGPALPKVPEVQRRGEGESSRPAPAVAVPTAPAAPSGATASRQPWKRGKRGDS